MKNISKRQIIFALYNTPSYLLITQGYPSIFGKTMPLK